MIKGALGDGPFSFAGEHYTITDYDGQPKPVQRPHPPILIGGGGRAGAVIAAREADIVGINGTLTAGVDRPGGDRDDDATRPSPSASPSCARAAGGASTRSS